MAKPSRREVVEMPPMVDLIIREKEDEIRDYRARNLSPSHTDAKKFAAKLAASQPRRSNLDRIVGFLTAFIEANPADEETISVDVKKLRPLPHKRKPKNSYPPHKQKTGIRTKKHLADHAELQLKISPFHRDVLRRPKTDTNSKSRVNTSARDARLESYLQKIEKTVRVGSSNESDLSGLRRLVAGEVTENVESIYGLGYPEPLEYKEPRLVDVKHAPNAEMLQQSLVDQFQAAIGVLGRKAAKSFVQDLLDRTFGSTELEALPDPENHPVPLPEAAPALYKERRDRKQKPEDFIWNTYRTWLHQPGGLPRNLLLDIDEPLYRAIYKHGISDELKAKMPTAQGVGGGGGNANSGRKRIPSDSDYINNAREKSRQSSQRHRERRNQRPQ